MPSLEEFKIIYCIATAEIHGVIFHRVSIHVSIVSDWGGFPSHSRGYVVATTRDTTVRKGRARVVGRITVLRAVQTTLREWVIFLFFSIETHRVDKKITIERFFGLHFMGHRSTFENGRFFFFRI